MSSDDDGQIRERFERWNESIGDVAVPPPTFVTRSSSRNRVVSLGAIAVLVLLVVAGGLVARQNDTTEIVTQADAPVTEAPTSTPASVKGSSCGESASSSTDQLQRASAVMGSAPLDARTNTIGFPSLDAASRVGRLLPPARVAEVVSVDLEPFNVIPGEAGSGPTNSYAGNSVVWSGVRVRVDSDAGPLDVPIALSAGGADVVKAEMASVDRTAFDGLVGSCAVVFVDNSTSGPLGSANALAAVASQPKAAPVILDRRFRSLRNVPVSLEAVAP